MAGSGVRYPTGGRNVTTAVVLVGSVRGRSSLRHGQTCLFVLGRRKAATGLVYAAVGGMIGWDSCLATVIANRSSADLAHQGTRMLCVRWRDHLTAYVDHVL